DERGFSPVIYEISPRVIVVRPGEEFDLKINFTIRQFTHFPPGIRWQVFLLYSWAPTWPPPRGYYTPLYDGIPPCDGRNIARTIRVKAPETPGEYYIWVGVNHHYDMHLAIGTVCVKPPLPAHVKIIVRETPEEDRNIVTVAQTIPIGGCEYITKSGYYLLVRDIQSPDSDPYIPCIRIAANNVVFDGGGHMLTGPGRGCAINVYGNNVVIKNVRIKTSAAGICVSHSSNVEITDSTLEGDNSGIAIASSRNVTVRNVLLLIRFGLKIHNSQDIVITNSIFVDSSFSAIKSTNIKVFNNTFLSPCFFSPSTSIYIYGCVDVSVVGNVIMGGELRDPRWGRLGDWPQDPCLKVLESKSLLVADNIVSGCYHGIYLNGVTSSQVINNKISNNKIGIWVNSSSDYVFAHNRFIENDVDVSIAQPIITASASPVWFVSNTVDLWLLVAFVVLNIVLIALLLRRRRGRSVGEETIVRTPTERRGLEVEIIEDKKERGDHTSR
ncbi:MAG: NosD domain-containing protein, partial [Pyrobaculum sp.]